MRRPLETGYCPSTMPAYVVRSAPSRPPRRRRSVWRNWPDEQLLDVRMCDLGVTLEGSALETRLRELDAELDERGFRFRPHYWLSDDWFTPDDVPGVAIPFYLAHPRLMQLEQAQLLEVEGRTRAACMRILRHELGHAVDNAYRLRRRRRRQQLFGKSSIPYPDHYTPKPYSKRFVLHLDSWYAQSHPDEDFAETFAVWLNPRSVWMKRYADWPARKKLEYVDGLMRTVAPARPLVASRRVVDPLGRLRKTLREHYERKRRHYGVHYPDFYDRDLRRLFSDAPEFAKNSRASRFLNRIRAGVRRNVARWTSTSQYTIDQVLGDMVARCDALNLRLTAPEEQAKLDFTVLLTVQTMNYLHSGRHRLAL